MQHLRQHDSTVRLIFEVDNDSTQVTMYGHQLEAYFKGKKMADPDDKNDVVLALLTDEVTSIVCNRRNDFP